MRRLLAACLIVCVAAAAVQAAPEDQRWTLRSVRDGAWSDAKSWEPGRAPRAGDRVLISAGTRIVYDVKSDQVLPIVQVSGTLTFARDRDTRLAVCVLKVQTDQGKASPAGVEDVDENAHGHDDDHDAAPKAQAMMPALEVGTLEAPIPANFTAEIILTFVEGFDPAEAPAIVCRPGCRMDFHGSPMSRTWLDLQENAKRGDEKLTLSQAITGWKAGDELLITGGSRQPGRGDRQAEPTSERVTLKSIDGQVATLSTPLKQDHIGRGQMRCEAANLTRSVIIRSADSATVTGHTMYHRHSAGAISYARFERLGKKGTLGRYPIHFHRVRDTMRGSSVVGAAIIDSQNRWTTIHGTDYMIVRDCVGHRSIGHGYFLEDGTEAYNLFDRNLGVGAMKGPNMKGLAIPYDPNDGAAFWWANARNAFVRNTACENEEYGYRFDCQKRSNFNSTMKVRRADGTYEPVDIRTLPTFRFEDNESHTEGLYAFVFAGTEGVGPDHRHPHMLKNLRAWEVHYAVRAQLPTMWVEDVEIDGAAYGIYRPWFDHHVYKDLRIRATGAEPFNRGQDDLSLQYGPITVDGVLFDAGAYGGQMPFIQISDNNVTGNAQTHVRKVTVINRGKNDRWPLVNLGGGPRLTPSTPKGVPVFLHDWYGPGRHAKVVSTRAKDLLADGEKYRKDPPLTGDESVAAEVKGLTFPTLLEPVDDEPPATVITTPARGVAARLVNGALIVRGTTHDNSRTVKVTINGVQARSVDGEFYQWEATLPGIKPGQTTLTAQATDAAGNVERTPHQLIINIVGEK